MAEHDLSLCCRPVVVAKAFGSRHAGVWSLFDKFRLEAINLKTFWPSWCYYPFHVAYKSLNELHPNVDFEENLPGALFGLSIATWRITQGVYRFDSTMAAAIVETPITEIPIEVLQCLPEWCVYIETLDGLCVGPNGEPIYGFFASLGFDTVTSRSTLWILIDDIAGAMSIIPIDLTVSRLETSLELAIKNSTSRQYQNGIPEVIAGDTELLKHRLLNSLTPILNLVLYLCAHNADFPETDRPVLPVPVKTKRGMKIFPPSMPRFWDVGFRIGAAIRSASQSGTTGRAGCETVSSHPGMRPHVRSAHWHTYRTGKRRVTTTLKWISPVLVKGEIGPIVPTVKEVLP